MYESMYEKNINGYDYFVDTIKREGKIYYGVFSNEENNTNVFKTRLIFITDNYDSCVDYINMW